ncbi:MAG: rhodanese-like domain-containing protein [Janthinobacterium lividum]
MTQDVAVAQSAVSAQTHATVPTIDAAGLRDRVVRVTQGNGEVAIIDVREERLYTEGLILFSTNLPYSRFELLLAARLPRRDVPVVLVDRQGELSARAAGRLHALGYTDVSILAGGVQAWQRAGNPLYRGFNVRSKAFAEIIEHELATPTLSATELVERRARGDDIVVLDSRRFVEYQDSTVPGAISVPGAELVRSVRDLAPTPSTTIVVSCGGRTRSIVGAQSLISAGVPNPTFSLRNGTGGLRLDDLPREFGATRSYGETSTEGLRWATDAARRLSALADTPALDPQQFARWRADTSRTLYVLDLRPADEYETEHLKDARNVSGGQLLQEIDIHAPVWGARVVLVDDAAAVRSGVTAFWLAQLGWFEVARITHDASYGELATGPASQALLRGESIAASAPNHTSTTPNELADSLRQASGTTAPPLIYDLSLSPAYQRGHIAGSQWLLREQLDTVLRQAPTGQRVILTSEDGAFAELALTTLAAFTGNAPVHTVDVRLLAGGNRAWLTAGLPLVAAEGDELLDTARFVDAWTAPQRTVGDTLGAIRAYLDWEIELLHQLEDDADRSLLIRGVQSPAAASASSTSPAASARHTR